MTKILMVMIGGSLGALCRYAVALLAVKLFGSRFPFGTLIVNLTGCFLIGISFSLSQRGSSLMAPPFRLFFVTGYLGSLTTFSTFAMETVNTIRLESSLAALPNFLLNNILGMGLVFLGMWIGRIDNFVDAIRKIHQALGALGMWMGIIR